MCELKLKRALNNKAPLLEFFPKNMTVQHNHNLFLLQFQAWYKKKCYMSRPAYLLYLDSRLVTYLPDLLNIPVMPYSFALAYSIHLYRLSTRAWSCLYLLKYIWFRSSAYLDYEITKLHSWYILLMIKNSKGYFSIINSIIS